MVLDLNGSMPYALCHDVKISIAKFDTSKYLVSSLDTFVRIRLTRIAGHRLSLLLPLSFR